MSQETIQTLKKLQTLLGETTKLVQEKKWGAAIAKLDEAVALFPSLDKILTLVPDDKAQMVGLKIATLKAAVLASRGDTKDRNRMGNHKDAIADYDRAIEINPQNASVYNNRGCVKDGMGDHKGALADYDQAIEINPQDARAYNNRGNTKNNMGDHKDAIADYDRAIEINSQYAMAYNNRGSVKGKMGDHENALADINRAIEISPQYAAAYSNRGNIKEKMGDYEDALADANRAIEINPQDARAYSIRGSTKTKMDNYEDALADYDRALEIDPADKTAIHNRAITLATQIFQKGLLEIEQATQMQQESSVKTSEELECEADICKYENKSAKDEKKINSWMAVWAGAAVLIALASVLPDWGIMKILASLPLENIMIVFAPLILHIHALRRSKNRHLHLLEEARRNLRAEKRRGLLQAELSDLEVGHDDKRGNENQNADWNRADTDGGNSPASVVRDIVNRLNPFDKGGD